MRPATDADKPYLNWLEEACMRDYAVALWGAWPADAGYKRLLTGCRIVVKGDLDVGCVTTIRQRDHVWLDELFIAPAFQRRGIGGAVLQGVVSDAMALGLPVRLSVLNTNPALAFYQRHGFHVDEETLERRFLSR